MLVVRPLLIVLLMMLSAIYVDAFSSEVADAREGFQSVAGDLLGLVHDSLNRKDQKVGFHRACLEADNDLSHCSGSLSSLTLL